MATITKEAAPKNDALRDDSIGAEAEGEWTGPKLVVLGIVSLGAALVFLYTISPFGGVVLP